MDIERLTHGILDSVHGSVGFYIGRDVRKEVESAVAKWLEKREWFVAFNEQELRQVALNCTDLVLSATSNHFGRGR